MDNENPSDTTMVHEGAAGQTVVGIFAVENYLVSRASRT
jgi:hypothetical protein